MPEWEEDFTYESLEALGKKLETLQSNDIVVI
jgi:hypothetical protein